MYIWQIKTFLKYTIVFLLSPAVNRAQIPSIQLEKYSTENGLTQNSTTDLLQDSRGFLWIGTGWGLNRFDGRVMKQYTKIGANGLVDLDIHSLAEDKEGNIWITTPIGVSCMDPFKETFTNYFEGTGPHNIPHGNCNIYCDKEDNVWIADSYSISLFNRETKTFTSFPVTTTGKDTRINKYIEGIFEDSKGRFWLSTSYGIKLFDRGKKTYRSYHFEETDEKKFVHNATQRVFEDPTGAIWAGTWNGGLLKLNAAKDIFEPLRLTGEPFDDLNTVHDINGIVIDNHFYLLLATEAGLVLADPQKAGSGTIPVDRIIEEPGAGAHNGKARIIKDKQNIYWITGHTGLLKIDMGNQVLQWKLLPDKSFSNSTIFHVVPGIKEPKQKVFLTTQDGWWEYDLATGLFDKHTLPKGFEKLLENINRFVTTREGYWFTSQVGVGFYNPTTKEVKDISALVTEKTANNVRTGVICKDNKGRIWFSVYRSGIRMYDEQTGKLTALFADSTQQDNLYGKSLFDMKQAADGSIFLTSGEKVYHINPANFSADIAGPEKAPGSSLERTGPRTILFDRQGRVLLLSKQLIYVYQNKKIVPLYPQKGLADFIMDDFLQDGEGNFWVTTNRGLFKTDTAFKEWINMSDKIIDRGIGNMEEIFRTANDEFIFTSEGRIGIFSLHALAKNNLPPTVIINRLRRGNQEQYLVSLKQQQWEVSYKDIIEIELSAINFSNEKGNRIFYKLEGKDDDWQEITGIPVIRYEQLPPGNYTFKVKGMNGDGAESKETILSFKVLPPFWRTWWFITLCAVAVAGTLYLFYHYRIKQLLREERLRSHIATDLHDDIGATLSSISFYSETIKQQTAAQLPQLAPMLDKMGETSREMVGNMSDIVWAINPENDSVEKMIDRMQNLASELCAVKNTGLHFTTDEKLNHLQLSMEQRRNIYLIFKEALNNSLKYSNCRNIIIELKRENHFLVLSVKDDGKGFNEMALAEKSQGGNGLKNMRHRATEINGKLVIDAEENKGTSILLVTGIT